MKSRSDKTGEGYTEWMIPEATVTALEIMERWARPYQDEIEREIMQRKASNPLDPEIAEAQRHRHAIFLGKNTNHAPYVRTLSIAGWREALKDFRKLIGLDWNLATHQFRRKFANYVAHSQYGDLRYLKDHFKHWTMDMMMCQHFSGHTVKGVFSMPVISFIHGCHQLIGTCAFTRAKQRVVTNTFGQQIWQ